MRWPISSCTVAVASWWSTASPTTVMPPQDLNDNDVAAVINYINVAMNQGKPVLTAEQVSEMRQVKK